MKQICFITFFSLAALNTIGQPLRNEWIDYSKTYYKFPVASNRLYRIPKTTLTTSGLGEIPAQDFQLWRNGEEVAIFTTQETGPLAADGFIEFMGKMNDGAPDAALFANPADQVNYDRSYFSDTAWYYLTVKQGVANKRIRSASNDVAGTTLRQDSFFMHTLRNQSYYTWNYGSAAVVAGQPIRSSLLNGGEGWAAQPFNNWFPLSFTISNLNSFTRAPVNIEFSYSVSGNYQMNRNIEARINDSLIGKVYSAGYSMKRDTVRNLPLSVIRNDALALKFIGDNDFYWENIYLNVCAIRYPRRFNFQNASYFEMTLPATATGNHLRMQGLRTDNRPIVVYDLSNSRRYTTIAKADSSLLLLPPSAIQRNMVMSNQVAGLTNISTLTPKQFTDFSKTANQGDYLIITHKVMMNPATGNQVQAYRDYRRSPEGGSYQAEIYDMDELAEQFAFGLRKHPIAIRNFVRFALEKFVTKPRFVFLLGHGTYYEAYRGNSANAVAQIINAVPTFGTPASDNLLVSADNSSPVPMIPIGRVSAVSNEEVGVYLEKVKQFEALNRNPGRDPLSLDWKKEVLHLVGGDDVFLSNIIGNFMNRYRSTISDTLMGAKVSTYKRVNNPDFALNMADITNRIDSGLGLITYFGHSSASSIDFNMGSPETYNNAQGRYPVFIANGCRAGNIFDFTGNRLFSKNQSLAENFMLAKNRGAISFISNSDLGIINYMHLFTNEFYKSFSKSSFGKTIGEIQREAIRNTWNITGSNDLLNRINLEQVVLQSDPALVPFPFTLPDYSVQKEMISILPAKPDISSDSVLLEVKLANTGMAIKDSVEISISREAPDGMRYPIMRKWIQNLSKLDSIEVKTDLKGLLDAGTNYIVVDIDPDNKKKEITKVNNSARLSFEVNTETIFPTFPYDLSIVGQSPVTLTGSTANAAAKPGLYRIQVDTTRYFNSPLLFSRDTFSRGGAINFIPNITWRPNTVYYWRLSPVNLGLATQWSHASFWYEPQTGTGFNQSHYFQHLQSTYQGMTLTEPSRRFAFGQKLQNLFIEQGIYGSSGFEDTHFSIVVNGIRSIQSGCIGQSILFNVFDGFNFKPWNNSSGGRFGSGYYCGGGREYNFEFKYFNHTNRKKIMDFLDSIPKGNFVVARLLLDPPYDSSLVRFWMRDTAIYGKGKSLYHALYNQGFRDLDSMNRPRTFAFVFMKDDTTTFKPASKFSEGFYDRIMYTQNPTIKDTTGAIFSPNVGPSASWKNLTWYSEKSRSPRTRPESYLELYGRKPAGNEVLLRTISTAAETTDLSGISAAEYPVLRMKMVNKDTAAALPQQLIQWRIAYDPVADGALSAKDYWQWSGDTITAIKDSLKFGIAFKNISNYSLPPAYYSIRLGNEKRKEISLKSGILKALAPGDTARLWFSGKTDSLFGKYYIRVQANEYQSPAEQTYINNLAYIPFYADSLKKAVTLTDFRAAADSNKVMLTWEVKEEIKVRQYEILYGTDSTQMSTIQVQQPLNTVLPKQLYSLPHTNPVLGVNYYRLKTVDKYGNISLTPAQAVMVRLTIFDALPIANAIKTYWSFENEMKIVKYDVQHAPAGGNWNTFATLLPSNTGAWQTSYETTHPNPSLGVNAYRLQYSDAYNRTFNSGVKLIEISLNAFNAQLLGKYVEATWQISNEINIADYQLEQGIDSNFMRVIHTQLPTGNNLGLFNYAHTHTKPAPGYNYYRLRVRDRNGNVAYSPIITIFYGNPQEAVVYPNPFMNDLYVVTSDNINEWTLSVYDALGRVLIAQTGRGTARINTTMLPKGNYFLKYQKKDEQITQLIQKR